MNICRRKFAVCCMLLLMSPLVRGADTWDYQKLNEGSDLIVIATVDQAQLSDAKQGTPDGLVRMQSKVNVAATLKGKTGANLTLRHHVIDRSVGTIVRRSMSVSDRLRLDREQIDRNSVPPYRVPHYLLFLKAVAGSDSEYELASGPRQEIYAIKLLDFEYPTSK